MVQKVTWLIGAQVTFNDALNYIEENFTEKEVQKFSERIHQKLNILKSHPRLGVKSGKKKNVYKTVINKRILLIYQYKPLKNEIVLLAFWNTLQNPKKLKI